MKVVFNSRREASSGADALILPVFSSGDQVTFREMDRTYKGLLSRVLKEKPSLKEKGQELIHVPAGPVLLLAGLGDPGKLDAERLRRAGGNAFSALMDYNFRSVALSVSDLVSFRPDYFPLLEGFLLSRYKYDRHMSEKQQIPLQRLEILKKESKEDSAKVDYLDILAEAVYLARDLVNSPANELTPSAMAGAAKSLAGKKLKVKILGPAEIKKAGMNAFYSVAKGSKEEPRMVLMEYSSGKKAPLIVLVGKSITFDSGGISIKHSDGMEKMKYDMAGGAAVIGVMKAISRLGLPVNVTGIVPACENLPSGTAVRPGDIVKSITGKTIEIISTDAEGRLLLADAMGYSLRMKPAMIIDIATLTGACSIAFGHEAIAMMGTDQKIMDGLRSASDATGERVWQMPLFEEYADYLKSDAADLKNVGGRPGGLITAGYFLKEFAGNTPWVHLDIAATAWNEKDRAYIPKGATGVGVRLLTEFIKESAG